MITTVRIPFHSFVDLITNSSSETFVCASKSTVTAIKKLVENLIAASGGTTKADELFDFEIVYTCNDADYNEHEMTEAQIVAKKAELEAKEKELDERESKTDSISERKKIQTEREELDWSFGDDDSGEGAPTSSVRVTVKDKTNKSAVAAAKVLEDLTGLFSIESRYC